MEITEVILTILAIVLLALAMLVAGVFAAILAENSYKKTLYGDNPKSKYSQADLEIGSVVRLSKRWCKSHSLMDDNKYYEVIIPTIAMLDKHIALYDNENDISFSAPICEVVDVFK